MSDLRARVAYLQGLAEGLDIDVDSPHGRLLAGVLDVLGDIAEEIEDLAEFQEDLAEYVDELEDNLSSVEDEVYGGDEIVFVPEDGADDVVVLTCPRCGEPVGAQGGQVPDEDLEVTCPVCGCTMEPDEAYE